MEKNLKKFKREIERRRMDLLSEHVTRNENLSYGAKLLFSDILQICKHYGWCRLQNRYFAKRYNTNKRTIKRWIASLMDEKLIKKRIKLKYHRFIFLYEMSDNYVTRRINNTRWRLSKEQIRSLCKENLNG